MKLSIITNSNVCKADENKSAKSVVTIYGSLSDVFELENLPVCGGMHGKSDFNTKLYSDLQYRSIRAESLRQCSHTESGRR